MKPSETLPIFKEAQRLSSLIVETSSKAPKPYRYTLISRLINLSLDLIGFIDTANRDVNTRIGVLLKASATIQKIKTLVFISVDSRCFSLNASALIIKSIEKISEHLDRWIQYSKERSS